MYSPCTGPEAGSGLGLVCWRYGEEAWMAVAERARGRGGQDGAGVQGLGGHWEGLGFHPEGAPEGCGQRGDLRTSCLFQ